MRVRIHKPAYRLEFEGSAAVWNELLRPLVGGPEGVPDPVAPAMTSAPGPEARADAAGPAPIVRTVVPAAPGSGPAPIVRTYVPPLGPAVPVAPGVRTWIPPRENRPPRFDAPRDDDRAPRHARDDRGSGGDADASGDAPWRRPGGPEPEVRVEPSNDPATLYARLLEIDTRRAEKDAVLAAVWFIGQDAREVHEKEVEKHFDEHGGPPDAKIRPHFLKHIARTKYFEPGTKPGLVRLTRKGREQVRLLCGV